MFRTDTKVSARTALLLGLLPFLLIVSLYMWGSHQLRVQEASNSNEAAASSKLMPTPSQMFDGFNRAAFEQDNKGDYRLLVDTVASLKRFAFGIALASLGIVLGLYMGMFPLFEALFLRFFSFVDKVPPLLLLPILFIYLGVDELAKVALVVIGVLPGLVLDAFSRTKEIQKEQFHKAQTLGSSETEIAWLVVFPQILPKMIGSLRLNFKSAWGYVIAGESVAAAIGIGYRIFVLRRYVAMDTILPYLFWATLLMFAFDYLFQWLEKRYVWVDK